MLPLILETDAGGAPYRWIDVERAAKLYCEELVAWDFGDDFRLHGGIQAATGIQSRLDIKSIVAVKGFNLAKLGDRVKGITLTNRTLYQRDQHTCAYCGNEFFERDLSADHVMPTSRGGKDIWTNLVTSCKRCNNKKDDRTPEEAHMRLLYVPYEPCRSEHLILSNRRILADQMDFLKSTIRKKK